MKYICRGPRHEEIPNLRVGCGYNLSVLIAEVPEDGEEHEVTCPKCENVAKVRRVPIGEVEG